MPVTLARATLAQTSPIVALMESAYRGDTSRKGWTSEADLIDGARTNDTEIAAAINDPATYFIVASGEDSRLIGCASITQDGDACYFGRFAVDPDLQGGGLGKTLLSACEEAAVSHFGVSRMTMTVIEGRRELEAYYERRGYMRTGQTVLMADLHPTDDMTIGHDLVLYEYAKDLS
jgi:N-acetylglutamate synthase-like GNAT family acetyltransferase